MTGKGRSRGRRESGATEATRPGRVSRRDLLRGAAAGAATASTLSAASASAAPTAHASSAGKLMCDVDVAVVGAGISGLYAAYLLSKKPRTSFTVLEARGRTGGRILNASIGVGKQVVEAGAEFIGAQDTLLRHLVIRELKLPIYDTFGDGDHQGSPIVDFGKPVALNKYSFPLVPPEDAAETLLLAQTFDDMAEEVPLDDAAKAENAAAWDVQTFDTWLQNNVDSADVRAFYRVSGYGLFGAEPGDASLLQFIYALQAHGGVYETAGITGAAQQNRVNGGSQLITDTLAARVGSERIVRNAPVRAIDQRGRRILITTDRGTVRAGAVILAIPPTFAGAIEYQPQLPIRRAQLTQQFPMGYAVKVHAVYPKPFWRQLTTRYPHTPDGLSGIVLSKNGPLSLGFDNSPGGADATTGVLLGFVFGANGRAWGSLPAKARRAQALAQFARWFGPKAAHPIRYMEKDWSAEAWTRGYIGYPTTRVWLDYHQAFFSNLGRIFLAGTESAGNEGYGAMEGALHAAARAVERAVG